MTYSEHMKGALAVGYRTPTECRSTDFAPLQLFGNAETVNTEPSTNPGRESGCWCLEPTDITPKGPLWAAVQTKSLILPGPLSLAIRSP